MIGGHAEAIEFIEQHRKKFNIKRMKRLSVSGAFHTPLMKSARKQVEEFLKTIDVRDPAIPVYSNVTATYYRLPLLIAGSILRNCLFTDKSLKKNSRNEMDSLNGHQVYA